MVRTIATTQKRDDVQEEGGTARLRKASRTNPGDRLSLRRPVGFKAAAASSKVEALPLYVRSGPSRTRRTISLNWARSDSTRSGPPGCCRAVPRTVDNGLPCSSGSSQACGPFSDNAIDGEDATDRTSAAEEESSSIRGFDMSRCFFLGWSDHGVRSAARRCRRGPDSGGRNGRTTRNWIVSGPRGSR
jgi:hypothetical protein